MSQNQLRFVIGPTPNDFRAFLGDQDISDRLLVKSFRLKPIDADSGATTVELEVYADRIDVVTQTVNVHVVGWPRRTPIQWLRNLWDTFMLHVGDPIRRRIA